MWSFCAGRSGRKASDERATAAVAIVRYIMCRCTRAHAVSDLSSSRDAFVGHTASSMLLIIEVMFCAQLVNVVIAP